MDLSKLNALLAFAPPAQPGHEAQPAWVGMVPLILLIVVFYFILIRPQQKKAKEHAQLLKTIKPGDRVLTSGGIVGVVITVKDKTLSMRSGDSKFEIAKSAVTEITGRSGESGES